MAGNSGPLHPKPKDPPSHTTSPTEDTIYDDDQLPNEEIPLEDLPLLALPHEEQGFEEIPAEAEEQLLEHLAAPRWADWVPFANDQPPVYASKVLTQAQRQAAKLKKKLKNSPYPLDFFQQSIILPQMEDLPEHYAAPYDPFNNLILLIKHLPPRFNKTELYQAVEYILHTRYLGLILLMGILGYDIERTRLRLLYCDKIYFYHRKI